MKRMSVFALAVLACLSLSAHATQAVNTAPIPQQKPATGQDDGLQDASWPLPQDKPAVVENIRKSPVNKAHKKYDQNALIKYIFEAQARGDMDAADELLKQLNNELLLGHILYQRYMHPTAYRSSFEELKYWLDLYADHPGAARIYKMAVTRKPSDFSGVIKKPAKSKGVRVIRNMAVDNAKRYRSTAGRSRAQRAQYIKLRSKIRSLISRGRPSQALNMLNDNRNLMDENEVSIFKAEIARGYFYVGHSDKALRQSKDAISDSGEIVPLAHWIAGLVSWQDKDYNAAAKHFKNAASSDYASGWIQAAASFWAARSLMRTGEVREVSSWLEKANDHPRTFYGLLAMRALGRINHYNWKTPNFTRSYYNMLKNMPQGKRAMALVEAGQPHLAEEEFLNMDVDGRPDLQNALLSYAKFTNLPRLALRLGNRISDEKNGRLYEAALYPLSDWQPTDGYQVDASLIHAIIHQESKFNPLAKNGGSGASGLMQLMPATAHYTAKKYGYGLSDDSQLLQPQINLDIGQLYLQHLLKNPLIKGNVIKLLVAYNAGPGNLKRWWEGIDHGDDPLLFVEMIPVAETRAYIERVLANYWMYRIQSGESLASLDALTEGQWAIYDHMDHSYQVAVKP